MKKFESVLICTDLDDTLLTSDKRVSEENKKAIEYFTSEGGSFTFATGRAPIGAKLLLNMITPNCPMVCLNGAGVYDFNEDKYLWELFLDEKAAEVVRYVEERLPFSGIEICTNDKIYFSRVNEVVLEHKLHENLPENTMYYTEIPERWKKVLFMQQPELVDEVRQLLKSSPYWDDYSFLQSSPKYYELLPKKASKGNAMLELASILNINPERTIGIGDNENDISLVKMAGIGVAVANAVDEVRAVADYITLDNNHHAIAAVIEALDSGKMKFGNYSL